MNREKLKKKTLEMVKSRPGKKFRRRELYNMMRSKQLGYQDFKRLLDGLVETGEIERTGGRRFALPVQKEVMTGVFTASRGGHGFIRLPNGETIFVKRGKNGEALTGDTVQIRIRKRGRVGVSRTGVIVSVVERSTKPVIGIFARHGTTEYVIPQDKGFLSNLLIKNRGEHPAQEGDLVVCRVEMPVRGFSRHMCVVTEVLGDPEAPGVDVLTIMRRHNLPAVFPEEVLRESEMIPGDLDEDTLAKRRDLRGTVTFTIDPVDAKDFDDAISLSRTEAGWYELGIHIADVAYYMKDNTLMDIEAKRRGMSCYLVDRVLPMLPERLSNDLCSLKPGVDRLTKSVFATLDETGAITGHEIVNTVIRSSMRLTYGQAQDYLDGKTADSGDEIPPGVGEALSILSELTDVLVARRTDRGAVDLDLPETKVILDAAGKPVDIVRRTREKAHRMIEEAMLLANTITAEVLAEKNTPFLYRIHDKPSAEKLETFADIVMALGYQFDPGKAHEQEYIQAFLASLKGKKNEQILNMLLLRSMKKAGYSPRNIGHYGLALSTYAHFTSPIRRYPDLIVHRRLDDVILGNGSGIEHDFGYYEDLGSELTEREITIDNAERDSIKMKTAEFMEKHIGEEFEGAVSGIIPIGIFVGLDRFFVEGLIHASTLDDDYYEMEPGGVVMSGRHRGRRFTFGDRLRVVVTSVVKERGEVNFALVERLDGKKKRKKK